MKKFSKLFSQIIIILFVIYTFLGFFILPYFIQFYIPTIIKNTIHSESYVDSVHFNPYTFKIKISNLIIQDQNQNNLLFFETLKINVDPLNLILKEISFSDIVIDNLKLSVDINKNKVANFQYILDSFNNENNSTKSQANEEKNNFLIKIKNLNLSNIRVVFEDYSKEIPFIVHTKPISLATSDIQLKPNHINKINLEIDTKNTGKIALQSNIIVEPLSLNGHLKLSQVAVNKIFHYVKPSNIDFTIDSQPLNLSLDYHYTKSIQSQNIELDTINLQLEKLIFSQNPFTIEIEKLLHTTQKVQLEIADTLHYNVTNINSKIQNIIFANKTNSSTLLFTNFANAIDNVSHNKDKTINIIQSLNTPQSGTIQANVKAIQEPLNLNIKLDTKNIAITPYEPYIKEFINMDIKSAFINNEANINVTNENNQTNINLQTDIALKNVDVLNSINKQQLFKLDTLNVSNMNYTNNNLFIKNISIEKPFVQFSINDNNTTNFSNLVPQTPQQKSKSKSDTQEFIYKINNISIKNGDALFEDNSVSPKFISKDTKIAGKIKNLSSDKNKPTVITHSSIIDSYAPLLINTNMILSDPTKALKSAIKVENIDLPSLSSYSGKFIGQKIANGKLSLTLDYNIKKSQMTSSNNIKIKDIKLGEKVESKDAINAPIGLAIALLEDSDGYIDLDIPIDGDINNPNFHLGDVILDVITNTIVGIVSAPFKFLAMMIGLDGEDISNVTFDYGSSTILTTQKEKLDNIIKAFAKRPNLKLKIVTAYVQEEDTLALKEVQFKEKYGQIGDDNFNAIYEHFIKEFGKESYRELKGEKKEIYQHMITKLKNNIKIASDKLILLAKQRAIAIQSYLLEKKLPSDRIVINENVKNVQKDLKTDKALILFEIEAK